MSSLPILDDIKDLVLQQLVQLDEVRFFDLFRGSEKSTGLDLHNLFKEMLDEELISSDNEKYGIYSYCNLGLKGKEVVEMGGYHSYEKVQGKLDLLKTAYLNQKISLNNLVDEVWKLKIEL